MTAINYKDFNIRLDFDSGLFSCDDVGVENAPTLNEVKAAIDKSLKVKWSRVKALRIGNWRKGSDYEISEVTITSIAGRGTYDHERVYVFVTDSEKKRDKTSSENLIDVSERDNAERIIKSILEHKAAIEALEAELVALKRAPLPTREETKT